MIAIIVAIASWFRPAPEPETQASEQQFSEQEVADAKEAMCEAWETTYSSIKNVASKNSPDPTLTYVFVLESQVVFHVAGNYLADRLRENPAAPAELTDTFARLINSYQDMVLARLGDLPEAEVEPIKNRMDSAADAIKQECK